MTKALSVSRVARPLLFVLLVVALFGVLGEALRTEVVIPLSGGTIRCDGEGQCAEAS